MSMPSLIVPASVLAAILAAAPAWAHEGGTDTRGEVVSADAKQVTVRSGDGHEQRYALTPQTRITVGGIVGTAADLTPGLRAVVHGKKVVDVVTAASVQLGSPKEPVGSKRPSAP
jgi:hypothetical protein